MRKKQSSLTAAGIAVMRAIESRKPADERICYDPLARRLVPGWLYALTSFVVRIGYAERRGPGVMGFLVARERYIDDTLQSFLDRGLQQLVILGAGFDSRAYRFEGLKKVVCVFEVDHPATQADKLERLKVIFGAIPAQVTYVPVDFNIQSLAERLGGAGYDPGRKTLFIWQGVTMYLTAEAVDDTLAFVSRNAARGSAIVFDYLYRSALDGTTRQSEVRNMRRYRFMTGEGLTFGIEEGTVQAFLEQRGFGRVIDVNAADLKRAYFTGKNAGRAIAPGYGIALAEIDPKS